MSFAEFWGIYPRKVAKFAAQKCWDRLDAAQQKEAIEGLERYRLWISACGTEPQYILHASTYLHQQRWADEYTMPETAAPQVQWWKSESATLAMAKKVGVVPGQGEGWDTLRDKIRSRLVRSA